MFRFLGEQANGFFVSLSKSAEMVTLPTKHQSLPHASQFDLFSRHHSSVSTLWREHDSGSFHGFPQPEKENKNCSNMFETHFFWVCCQQKISNSQGLRSCIILLRSWALFVFLTQSSLLTTKYLVFVVWAWLEQSIFPYHTQEWYKLQDVRVY